MADKKKGALTPGDYTKNIGNAGQRNMSRQFVKKAKEKDTVRHKVDNQMWNQARSGDRDFSRKSIGSNDTRDILTREFKKAKR